MTYKLFGITEDRDTCHHCGRTDLRRVVVLAETDADGNAIRTLDMGTTCAANALRYRGTNARLEAEAAGLEIVRTHEAQRVARYRALVAAIAAADGRRARIPTHMLGLLAEHVRALPADAVDRTDPMWRVAEVHEVAARLEHSIARLEATYGPL